MNNSEGALRATDVEPPSYVTEQRPEVVQAPNPFARAVAERVNAGAVEIASSTAIAEAQGKMLLAKRFPRDEGAAYQRILMACRRPELAAEAFYKYDRGGGKVVGPSIRLAEELARCWTNFESGLSELSRRDDESEYEAYAWDYESNTRTTQRFTVRHVRDTKQGPKALTDERDRYEIGANMGARRMRARILAMLPAWYVDAAVQECQRTVAGDNKTPLAERQRAMVMAFSDIGVTPAMLSNRLGHPTDQITPEEMVDYRGILVSIKEGARKISDWFAVQQVGNQFYSTVDQNTVNPRVKDGGPLPPATPSSGQQGEDAARANDVAKAEAAKTAAAEATRLADRERVDRDVADAAAAAQRSGHLSLVDADGVIMESHDDPVAYATAVVNHAMTTHDREGFLLSNSADMASAGRNHPRAAQILASMAVPALPPIQIPPLQISRSANGVPLWPSVLKKLLSELDRIHDLVVLQRWSEVRRKEVNGMPPAMLADLQSAIEHAASRLAPHTETPSDDDALSTDGTFDQGNALGEEPLPYEPEPAALAAPTDKPDIDAAWAQHVINVDFANATTERALHEATGQTAFATRMTRFDLERPDLAQLIRHGFTVRRTQIRNNGTPA